MKKTEPSDKDEGLAKVYREIGPYLGLGLQLTITVGVMVLLGVWLDGTFKTSPILTVVFAFLGVIAGMFNFIRSVLKSK